MASRASTTSVEIDSGLLEALRRRAPGRSDRALLEDLARMRLGFDTAREVQARSETDPDEALQQAVRAVHKGRRNAA